MIEFQQTSLITAQLGIVALWLKAMVLWRRCSFAAYFVPVVMMGMIRLLKPGWAREFWSKA